MIEIQDTKVFKTTASAVASNATNTLLIDRLGYDYCTIDVLVGGTSHTAITNKVIALAVDEGTNTNCGDAIVALTGTTNTVTDATNGFLIVASQTAVGTYTNVTESNYATFNIDCRNRKRYLRCRVTPATTVEIAQIARLSRAKTAPMTTTERNVKIAVTA